MEQARHCQAEHDRNRDKNVFVLGHTGNMPAAVPEYNLGIREPSVTSRSSSHFGKARAPLYAHLPEQIPELVMVMALLALAINPVSGLRYLSGAVSTR
jgi:hypothetical protein